jgi:hypothetical protein
MKCPITFSNPETYATFVISRIGVQESYSLEDIKKTLNRGVSFIKDKDSSISGNQQKKMALENIYNKYFRRRFVYNEILSKPTWERSHVEVFWLTEYINLFEKE